MMPINVRLSDDCQPVETIDMKHPGYLFSTIVVYCTLPHPPPSLKLVTFEHATGLEHGPYGTFYGVILWLLPRMYVHMYLCTYWTWCGLHRQCPHRWGTTHLSLTCVDLPTLKPLSPLIYSTYSGLFPLQRPLPSPPPLSHPFRVRSSFQPLTSSITPERHRGMYIVYTFEFGQPPYTSSEQEISFSCSVCCCCCCCCCCRASGPTPILYLTPCLVCFLSIGK